MNNIIMYIMPIRAKCHEHLINRAVLVLYYTDAYDVGICLMYNIYAPIIIYLYINY